MNPFVGTGALVRLILRRDRIVLPIWIVVLAALPLGIASSFAQLYPTAEIRQAFVNGIASNPVEVALLGPIFGATLGNLVAWRSGSAVGLLVGLASLLMIVRHTRADEEAGRRELLGATVVGRQAALAAALIVTCGADLVVGCLAALGLIGVGLAASGAWALGLSLTVCGWVFAAIAAIAAQLVEGAGSARGIAAACLGLGYVLRAIGDGSGEHGTLHWLRWLTPFGWLTEIRPFAGERWWIFVPVTGVVIGLAVVAFLLAARRDLGAGLLPPRLGPPVAAPRLRSPLALAWRLQRGTLLGWIVGAGVLGAVFGTIAQTVTDQLRASPQLMALLAQAGNVAPSDAFFTLALTIFLGEVLPVYAILATLRLYTEEETMRADPVLSTAVSRVRWAGSYVIVAALGTAAVLMVFGATAGLTYGVSSGDVGRQLPRVLLAALAYLPALWVLGGITVALWGWRPRLALLSWVVLAGCLLIELLGELQQVSQAVLNISPFTHVPKLLVSQASALPLVWLLVVSALFTAVGLVRFQQRDIG